MRRKKQPDPEMIRLTNLSQPVIPGFTICNLSEADLRALHDGSVPTWIHETAAFWLRDQAKPSDVQKEHGPFESGNCPHCGAWVNFAQEHEINKVEVA